ncbi:MAG: hypothetical protein M3083_06490 [Actinomycetota bacterium]|nr:hypothetical protein [Actinomycetota bacterium]
MPDVTDELNLSELEDGYLKVLLLLAARRASSSEPRQAGFWHGLAGLLSAEQEKRQAVAAFGGSRPVGLDPAEIAELEAVLDEMRRDLTALESEYRAAYGHLPAPGAEAPAPPPG